MSKAQLTTAIRKLRALNFFPAEDEAQAAIAESFHRQVGSVEGVQHLVQFLLDNSQEWQGIAASLTAYRAHTEPTGFGKWTLSDLEQAMDLWDNLEPAARVQLVERAQKLLNGRYPEGHTMREHSGALMAIVRGILIDRLQKERNATPPAA